MPLFFQNFVGKVKQAVGMDIDARMDRAGKAVVMLAKEIVPVRTGKLRDSIGFTYRQDIKELRVHADMPYALFVEKGTYKMAARPYLEPALEQAAGVFAGNAVIELGTPTGRVIQKRK